jgi:iron(II)-dependent oxidoreductase
MDLLRPDLAELYDAFETPRSMRGEVKLLVPSQAHSYLRDVRARTAEVLTTTGVGDSTVYEMVLRHELQHTETMRQTMALAGLLPANEPSMGRVGSDDTLAKVSGSRCRPVRSRWAPDRTGSPMTTSGPATRWRSPRSRSRAAR